MTPIEPSLYRRLCSLLGHKRIYPEAIPMKETDEGEIEPECALPAIAYRLVSGDQVDSFAGKQGLKTDSFLIECFDRDADSLQSFRTTMFDEFKGPANKEPGKMGWPVQWIDGGPKIRTCEATDPSADTNFEAKDAHDMLRFQQLLLTIQYHPPRPS